MGRERGETIFVYNGEELPVESVGGVFGNGVKNVFSWIVSLLSLLSIILQMRGKFPVVRFQIGTRCPRIGTGRLVQFQ
jgi:hypothetical protein